MAPSVFLFSPPTDEMLVSQYLYDYRLTDELTKVDEDIGLFSPLKIARAHRELAVAVGYRYVFS